MCMPVKYMRAHARTRTNTRTHAQNVVAKKQFDSKMYLRSLFDGTNRKRFARENRAPFSKPGGTENAVRAVRPSKRYTLSNCT